MPLSRRNVILLAIASAIVTANAYYIHPIIARVATDFGVSNALVGAVPAFNQIALAFGILFLLPLGDRVSNRKLTAIFLAAQVLSLIVMALAQSFWLFVAGSTILGFFTITPYLLPAFASKRTSAQELGSITAILATGVIAGILLSRTGAGVIGEYLGWRNVYWLAAALMLAATIMLPFLLDDATPGAEDVQQPSYAELLLSLPRLIQNRGNVIVSGILQGLNFGIFLSVWMGVGLHLTSDALGYGVDDVGYLAAFSALNLLTTHRLGRMADKIGPEKARVICASVQFIGVLTLFLSGNGYWILLLPITITSIAGPMIDITGRMTLLREDPAIRTRLMTVYVTLMFIGGGLGSWSGTIVYDLAGWGGTSLLSLIFSSLIVILSYWQWKTR